METRSFTIIASNKSLVESQIEKLNRRAKKLGLEEISFSFGKAFLQSRQVLSNAEYSDLKQVVTKEYLVLPVELSGPFDVCYNGWQFVAAIQHLPHGENLILRSISKHEIPKKYYTVGPICEHCNINRYRKDTYLLHHERDGFRVVGSTCIKDFLGGNSPDNILNRANFVSEVISFMDGVEERYPFEGADSVYHIEKFLAQANACIRERGWTSKSRASDENLISTAEWVRINLDPRKDSKESELSPVQPEDIIIAKKAIEWAEFIPDLDTDKNDYLYNIRTIVRSGMVGSRTFGFAASIIQAYNRFIESLKPKTISKYVGTLKKREVFTLTLKKHLCFDSMYGTTHKLIFNDPEGNVLLWSTNSSHSLEEGKSYLIKGTVKDHTEYKEIKQTILTRCEVVGNF